MGMVWVRLLSVNFVWLVNNQPGESFIPLIEGCLNGTSLANTGDADVCFGGVKERNTAGMETGVTLISPVPHDFEQVLKMDGMCMRACVRLEFVGL
jgi:hypothetical protein